MPGNIQGDEIAPLFVFQPAHPAGKSFFPLLSPSATIFGPLGSRSTSTYLSKNLSGSAFKAKKKKSVQMFPDAIFFGLRSQRNTINFQ